jgi:predicted transcriptional regulator of viral defense system
LGNIPYNMCILFNMVERVAHMNPVSNTSPDHQQLYQIAEQQAGYFTAAQAQAVGFSRPLLSHYAKTGHFDRVQRGIYRLAHFPGSPYQDLFVAWLRTGPDSVISHESALAVYELSDVLPGEVHVIVPRTASRRRKGIRLHTHRLGTDEVTQRPNRQRCQAAVDSERGSP